MIVGVDIDPYPVSELTSRYSIGKQAVYNRLEALSIKPEKYGNRSYLSCEQLHSLDRLHEHLANGGTLAKFEPPPTKVELSLVDSLDTSTRLSSTNDLIILVERLAVALRPTEPLAHWKQLETAVAHDWLLTTTEVKAVIGVKPKGDSFTRGCFTFIRAGKIGNQISWQVVRSNQ